MDTNSYRNILLTSCGLYPQVITEAIYGLAHQDPPVHLDDIHVVTTQVGLEHIKQLLLDEEHGHFYKLCEEYGLSDTHFEVRNIALLETARGTYLDDVQSVADNEAVANTITNLVRELTEDPDTALHVLLAGGRRTVSYYLGYALSLFGRKQDHLYHVIVSHDFEADNEFFYPNSVPTFITDRKGKKLNTQDAEVYLANIPYVRLRQGLPKGLIEGKSSFLDAVSTATGFANGSRMTLCFNAREVRVNSTKIELSPILFAWYSWIALRVHTLGQDDGAISTLTSPEDFIGHIVRLYGDMHTSLDRVRRALREGFTIDYISEKNSLVNKRLQDALNLAAQPFLIQSFGKRPYTQYSLSLNKDQVSFLNMSAPGVILIEEPL